MPAQLPPELVDFPTPYGLVVSMRPTDLTGALEFRGSHVDGISAVEADGLSVAVNHYASTPESGHEQQPIVTPSLILAYEGRIDNREEIAYLLGMPQLARQPDGTVLAAAYNAWGPSLSSRVIGEYAYAIFDRSKRQLVAGQDSLGVRRLFYAHRGGRILVTSNLRLLFQLYPEVRPSYDREVLCEYFAGTMKPWSGRTIWNGVSELGRGKALIQTGDQLTPRTVWEPQFEAGCRFRSADEVDEAFRKLLFEAVRAALRSSGPVLCDLSGGYDSSTVYSVGGHLIEAGESPATLIGWSIVHDRSNERKFQEAVRQRFRFESRSVDLAKCLPFQCFTDSEIPTGSFIQSGALNRATREFANAHGVRSHLTGDGGDVLLQKCGGGLPVYLADWFRQGRFREWSAHFLAYLKSGSYSAWQLARHCTLGTLDLHVGRHAPMPSWIGAPFQKQIRAARAEFVRTSPRTYESYARERMYRWTLCFIPYGGGGVPDERLPFTYRPLVEFLIGLDWQYLMHPNDERLLMRRSLKGIVPDLVLSGERCWTAFSAGIHEGLHQAWPRIAPYVTGDQLAELGVVDRKQFQLALEAMKAGYQGANGQFAKTALYLEAWLGIKAALRDQRSAPSKTQLLAIPM